MIIPFDISRLNEPGVTVRTRATTRVPSKPVKAVYYIKEANDPILYVDDEGEVWNVNINGLFDLNQGELQLDLVMEVPE